MILTLFGSDLFTSGSFVFTDKFCELCNVSSNRNKFKKRIVDMIDLPY